MEVSEEELRSMGTALMRWHSHFQDSQVKLLDVAALTRVGSIQHQRGSQQRAAASATRSSGLWMGPVMVVSSSCLLCGQPHPRPSATLMSLVPRARASSSLLAW